MKRKTLAGCQKFEPRKIDLMFFGGSIKLDKPRARGITLDPEATWLRDNKELEGRRTKARVSVKLGGSSSGQKQLVSFRIIDMGVQ